MKNELDVDKKLYSKTKFIVNLQLTFAGVLLSCLISLGVFELVYHGAFVPENYFFGVLLPVPLNVIIGGLIGMILLPIAFSVLFSKQILVKKLGDEYEEYAAKKLKESVFENFGEKSSKGVGAVLLAIAIIGIVIFSINNIGFYDDYCKFSDSHNILISKVAYEDLTLCKVDGYYAQNDARTYYEYDGNAYALVTDDGKSYDLGLVSDEFEDMLFEHFGNKYVEARSLEDILIDTNDKR